MFAGGVTEEDTQEILFLLQLLRLCCLSKHSGNQHILRERVRDGTSYSVIAGLCSLFGALAQTCDQTVAEPHRCETQIRLARIVSQTLEDMVVGPCLQSQYFLAFNTPLLHVVNQVFRTRVYFDDYADVIRKFPDSTMVDEAANDKMISLIRALQTRCLALLKAMLEGRPDTAVQSKVCDTIELSVLLKPMARAYSKILHAEEVRLSTPRSAARPTYARTHSHELEFGCSLMDLSLIHI